MTLRNITMWSAMPRHRQYACLPTTGPALQVACSLAGEALTAPGRAFVRVSPCHGKGLQQRGVYMLSLMPAHAAGLAAV